MHDHHQLSKELNLSRQRVAAIADLLASGNTVPFIARYRKEATGGADEVAIAAVRDGLDRLQALAKRRAAILASLAERRLLTDELQARVLAAADLTTLEDLYLPFRPKRRTRASVARDAGLEPLADLIQAQDGRSWDPAAFIDAEAGFGDAQAVLAGARDIIAERISEDAPLRQELRGWFRRTAQLKSSVIKKRREESEAARFRDWFDWAEPLAKAPSHRVLALLRGAAAKVLRVALVVDDEAAIATIGRHCCRRDRSPACDQVHLAGVDAWQRLLGPSLSNEAMAAAKERADAGAIAIFQTNLRELLLAAPLGGKRVLAVDPGLRTGCKIAVLDEQGDLLHHTVLHLATDRGGGAAPVALQDLVQKYQVQAIAVGDGTGSREAMASIRAADLGLTICPVSESGASIYSASEIAREEFPDLDLTVRGAISIGRRLQDPLAELVKLDPQAIGVGQYQHDVDATALRRGLADVVETCVNQVGVELNTASAALLTAVSGLGPKLAGAIVAHRTANGPFRSRAQLKKVPRLGGRAFEQCAGFLRIREGKHPLDASAVHPERYSLVEQMATDAGTSVQALLQQSDQRQQLDLQRYVSATVGLPTLHDIVEELAKPGRDPRPSFAATAFADVHDIGDLSEGMVLPGVVTNVTAFGAFVDVGVHQDGLVHISQLADRFIKDPAEVVKVRQQVQVRVLEVDLARKRISLSMRSQN